MALSVLKDGRCRIGKLAKVTAPNSSEALQSSCGFCLMWCWGTELASPFPWFFTSAVVLFFMKWSSEAAYCEWALAMDLFLLFGLFVVDFRHVGACSIHVKHQRTNQKTQDIQASTQTLQLWKPVGRKALRASLHREIPRPAFFGGKLHIPPCLSIEGQSSSCFEGKRI